MEKYGIKPLEVHNYASWSVQVQSWLTIHDLWSAIDLATDKDGNLVAAKASLDQKALASIRLAVSIERLPLLASCQTAHKAWELLKQMHKDVSAASVLQARRELANLEMQDLEPLVEYVARAQEIRARLFEAGDKVQDKEFLLSVLAGLPPVYDTISTVLMADDSLLTVHNALPKLLIVERQWTTRNRLEKDERRERAHVARVGAGGNSAGRYGPTCWFCGKKGHVKRNCPNFQHQKSASDNIGFTSIPAL